MYNSNRQKFRLLLSASKIASVVRSILISNCFPEIMAGYVKNNILARTVLIELALYMLMFLGPGFLDR